MIRMRLRDGLELIELNESTTVTRIETNMDELKKSFNFAKGLVVMYLMYSFSTLSLAVIVLIDINQSMHPYFHMYSWLFLRFCASATPIVFPLCHASLRRGYIKVFKILCLPKKKTEIRRVIYIHRRQLKQ